MNVLGVIPARGGSKGVPRKNLIKLGGKTLIEIAIDSASKSKLLTRTIVSTEDDEIYKIAREAGADLPFKRPMDLARDDSSSFSVVKHAVEWLHLHEGWETDIVVILQPTTPFRKEEHIDGVIELLINTKADAAITVRVPDYPPHWMLLLDSEKKIYNLIEGGNQYLRRQDTPTVYQPAGAVYALTKKLLYSIGTVLPAGDTRGYVISENDAVNIDTMLQYKLSKALWEENKSVNSS